MNVVREKRTGQNVVGYLPATASTAGVAKPWVALGARYDHLGHGERGGSLADKSEAGRVHAGADDNASGSAAVLAAGETLAAAPRRRHVMLAFWSAEELGLLGSTAFVNKPPVPIDRLSAYLNFDMVGRMQDNKLTVQATGTSQTWPRLIEQANVAAGFDLQVQADPYQPTDVASFNLSRRFRQSTSSRASHADYHRPTDSCGSGLLTRSWTAIVAFAAAIARRVSDLPEPMAFTKVEQTNERGDGWGGIRLFTGTIPDYVDRCARGCCSAG